MKLDVVSYIIGKADSGGGSTPTPTSESFNIAGEEYRDIPVATGDLIVIARNSVKVKALYWIDITNTPTLIAGSTTGFTITVSEGIARITNTISGVVISAAIYHAPFHA